MKLRVSTTLTYRFSGPTQTIGLIQAAKSPDQTILDENLTCEPNASQKCEAEPDGTRRFRASLDGEVAINYLATVDNGQRQLLPATGSQHLWSDLPLEVLPYLLPSRFCPSDRFQRFAQREFGNAGDGVARVMAVLGWVHDHIDYVVGTSTAETTAAETFMTRAGVCRDFTHLTISLCRALSIPARAVSAYAFALEPPDFHAIAEVYLEGAWWLVDGTRLAPVEGMVRIAHGRDAADIAFLTTDRACQVVAQIIEVSET
ncbi:transglutaminase [Bosea sp. Root483D1]|uniref:transglutaminase-like domain-containing protein n=1 Tax=Bosea sp. Root483D1 TaxID=1736544 RepID=UPI00070B579B|nr:transglutaminase family protein [Bosea sp. Root483D1]KRE17586.1 transglutaminase [Bosea sp. Root483D1]